MANFFSFFSLYFHSWNKSELGQASPQIHLPFAVCRLAQSILWKIFFLLSFIVVTVVLNFSLPVELFFPEWVNFDNRVKTTTTATVRKLKRRRRCRAFVREFAKQEAYLLAFLEWHLPPLRFLQKLHGIQNREFHKLCYHTSNQTVMAYPILPSIGN